MRLQRLKPSSRMLLGLWLMLSLTACSHQAPLGNQYFCPPTITYDRDGAVRKDVYGVDRTCYKSMTAKLAACYEEAK